MIRAPQRLGARPQVQCASALADYRLRDGVVVAVGDAPDRGINISFGQPLPVTGPAFELCESQWHCRVCRCSRFRDVTLARTPRLMSTNRHA